ncbi:MAG: acyl-CoA dehydrogenase family protein, partial [Phenylobacterium sp.]|nr:acyl-CoA dehydrogenase family protein [Phenylobacterium sp.]
MSTRVPEAAGRWAAFPGKRRSPSGTCREVTLSTAAGARILDVLRKFSTGTGGHQGMNFDFSDDQKFLKTEARKFLDANCPASRVRGVLDDGAKAFDQALWTSVAAQGWLGAAIPEDFGGLGLGHLELCVIAEELGRAVAPIPFASTVYFLAEAVMLAGS